MKFENWNSESRLLQWSILLFIKILVNSSTIRITGLLLYEKSTSGFSAFCSKVGRTGLLVSRLLVCFQIRIEFLMFPEKATIVFYWKPYRRFLTEYEGI